MLPLSDHLIDLPAPLFLLYAETHFRFFRFFPSLIFRHEPEVVFDLPRRVAPGMDLPILLIINDIDRFPVEVLEVEIALTRKGSAPVLRRVADFRRHTVDHPLSFQSSVFLFRVPCTDLGRGQVFVNAKAVMKRGKRLLTVLNDNFPGTAKAPFECRLADTPFPGKEVCSYGDLHVHSQFSQSHVEFGPPIPVIADVSAAYGLDFLGITDHSYDLACRLRNYLRHADGAERWSAFLREIDTANESKLLVIPGEEISCSDVRGGTVHLCAYGTRSYVPGSHDGARRNAKKDKQLSVREAANSVHGQGGLAFAAHPGNLFGRLQRVFLGRGEWTEQELRSDLEGIQAVNGRFDTSWERAKKLWIKELQRGSRFPIIGGSDAHGDFNRYRALVMPFIMVTEWTENHLSHVRTGIYGKPNSIPELLALLRQGKTFVTSGPFLCISTSESGTDSLISSVETELPPDGVFIICGSSYEYGDLRMVRLIAGEYRPGSERVIWAKSPGAGTTMQVIEKIPSTSFPVQGYMRAEASSLGENGEEAKAFTSCCFFYRRT